MDENAAADDAFLVLRNANRDTSLDDLFDRIGDMIEELEYKKALELLARLDGRLYLAEIVLARRGMQI